MRYLSLYVPAKAFSGPPSPELMQEMGKLVDEMKKSGKLIATGGLKKRETDGLVVTLKDGKYSVEAGPDCDWMRGNGFAILDADSREDVIEQAKRFLKTAGEGRSELIEINYM